MPYKIAKRGNLWILYVLKNGRWRKHSEHKSVRSATGLRATLEKSH